MSGLGSTGAKDNATLQSCVCSVALMVGGIVFCRSDLMSSPTLTPWYSAPCVPAPALRAVLTCSPPPRNWRASSSFYPREGLMALTPLATLIWGTNP